MKSSNTPDYIHHSPLESYYRTAATSFAFKQNHPMGGIKVSKLQSPHHSFRFAINAIIGSDSILFNEVRLHDIPKIRSFCSQASPNTIHTRLTHVFEHYPEEVIGLFYLDVSGETAWNSLIQQVQSQYDQILNSVPRSTIRKICSKCSMLVKDEDMEDLLVKLTPLDQETVSLVSSLLEIGAQVITENISVFIDAASKTIPEPDFFNKERDFLFNDLPRSSDQLDGTGSRISELAPSPLKLITKPHFAKLRTLIPDALFSEESTDLTDALDPMFKFLEHLYRRSTPNLSDVQFDEWCLYACNCATGEFII